MTVEAIRKEVDLSIETWKKSDSSLDGKVGDLRIFCVFLFGGPVKSSLSSVFLHTVTDLRFFFSLCLALNLIHRSVSKNESSLWPQIEFKRDEEREREREEFHLSTKYFCLFVLWNTLCRSSSFIWSSAAAVVSNEWNKLDHLVKTLTLW